MLIAPTNAISRSNNLTLLGKWVTQAPGSSPSSANTCPLRSRTRKGSVLGRQRAPGGV